MGHSLRNRARLYCWGLVCFLELSSIVAIYAAGAVAGVMNTVGGGGSVLTLPALIYLGGIPGVDANATNRIGIVIQNMIAVSRFRKGGIVEDNLASHLVFPALIGAGLGALLAAYLPNEYFERILGVLLLALLVPLIWKPKSISVESGQESRVWKHASPERRKSAKWIFFGLGVYMGFLQAGAGIMIIAALAHLFRLGLVRSNYVKLTLVLLVNLLAFGIFMLSGLTIYWVAGILLVLGQATGAWVGSWIALKKGEKWIMSLLVVCIVLSSYKLLMGH